MTYGFKKMTNILHFLKINFNLWIYKTIAFLPAFKYKYSKIVYLVLFKLKGEKLAILKPGFQWQLTYWKPYQYWDYTWKKNQVFYFIYIENHILKNTDFFNWGFLNAIKNNTIYNLTSNQ